MSYEKTVNSTCRENGAVGKDPVAYRHVLESYHKDSTILDFGAGTNAIHSQRLRDAGFTRVTAFDIGENFTPQVHTAGALLYAYDVVVASNVLNVQPDVLWLHTVLSTLNNCTNDSGVLVANYPRGPRKSRRTIKEMQYLLAYYFAYVVKEGTLFVARMPIRRAGK